MRGDGIEMKKGLGIFLFFGFVFLILAAMAIP